MASLVLTAFDQLAGLPDTFGIFADLSTSSVDPIQSNLVQLDLIVSIALYLVAPIVLIVMMVGRQRRFVRFYIRWAVVAAIFAVLDIMLGYSLTHLVRESIFGLDTLRELLGPAVALCAWTPYLLRSQRAKNTFVK